MPSSFSPGRAVPFVVWFALASSFVAQSAAQAQEFAPNIPNRVGAETRDQLLEGRRLLEARDVRAVAVLRDAAQESLRALNGATGSSALASAPNSFPRDVVTATLVTRAAQAHLAWGAASEFFARRDEAITAYARALRLSNLVGDLDPTRADIATDARVELTNLLSAGLPLVAPDDVVDAIATLAHGGLWKPRTISFDASTLTPEIAGQGGGRTEILITDGTLFTPRAKTGDPLFLIPALYRGLDINRLAPSMLVNQSVVGFAREKDGANKDQWRQIVRVYYASPRLTRDRRSDQARAHQLAETFGRVHTLFREQLGATNLYERGERDQNVTTLWLLEIGATWPRDDDDPVIQAQLPPRMPDINTGQNTATEPKITPLMRPWLPNGLPSGLTANLPVAGQSDNAPGEILFWKAGVARPESEWTRELMHEYGHVALPPLGGFAPPLEPFANGLIGETLAMLWADGAPAIFEADEEMRADFRAHVEAAARPAREAFIVAGPQSAARTDTGARGLGYLQGLNVYLERVYGAQWLGRAFAPLSERAANSPLNPTARRALFTTNSLFDSLDATWKLGGKNGDSLPIYLPAALNLQLDATTLSQRAPVAMTRTMQLQGWLYVPQGANSLRVDGPGAQFLRASGLAHNSAENAIRFHFAGKTGWQRISLSAENDAKIIAARFDARG